MVSTLRSTVLTYGEKALTPLPPREKEPVDLWLRASREELQEASQALWAWIMLPPEGGGAEGLEPRGEARQVKLHLRPFAEGALRYAFHLFLQGGKEELHLVVKESKFAGAHASPQKVHSFFLVNHRRAQALAVDFNKAVNKEFQTAIGRKQGVGFVPSYVIQLSDDSTESGFRYVTAERYIPGQYTKFNGNDGYVNSSAADDVAELAAAFSHFSFDCTDGRSFALIFKALLVSGQTPSCTAARRRSVLLTSVRTGCSAFSGAIGAVSFVMHCRCVLWIPRALGWGNAWIPLPRNLR